jgi:pimeloyl-ACP methyl ester carboxylesterase
MRYIFFFCLLVLLSACKSVVVEESQFIRPDTIAPYQSKGKFDNEALAKLISNAALKDESITVDPLLQLNGFSVKQTPAAVTVLYFGGNRSHIDDAAKIIGRHVGGCPINFTMFDYRGYGRTKGNPNVSNLKEDALRIYDYVKANTTGTLIIHGHSLGSFMTAYVAQQRQVDGIILETTATSVKDILRLRTPWYIKPFIQFKIVPSLQEIDNTNALAQYQGKSLVISAENDQTTPPELGLAVYQSIPSSNKKHLFVAGAGHNNLLEKKEVRSAYCEFVQSFQTSHQTAGN